MAQSRSSNVSFTTRKKPSQLRLLHARPIKLQSRSAPPWLLRRPKDAVSTAVVRRCDAAPAGGLLVGGKTSFFSFEETTMMKHLLSSYDDNHKHNSKQARALAAKGVSFGFRNRLLQKCLYRGRSAAGCAFIFFCHSHGCE